MCSPRHGPKAFDGMCLRYTTYALVLCPCSADSGGGTSFELQFFRRGQRSQEKAVLVGRGLF